MVSVLRTRWWMGPWLSAAVGAIRLLAIPAAAEDLASAYPLPLEQFRSERPRLFLSPDNLPAVRDRAAGECIDRYREGRDYMAYLEAKGIEAAADYGYEAGIAAFLYRCEQRPADLALATRLLAASWAHYRECDRANRAVNWYSTTRAQAIAAYDWLYEDLDPGQRESMGRDILDHVRAVQPEAAAVHPCGRNCGDHTGGGYGTPSLKWYAGVATLKTGIDEAASESLLWEGYRFNLQLLDFRRSLAQDDGGSSTATLLYALVANPWAEFNFFHTMKSAFGVDIAPDWPHVAYLSNFVLWNRLPGNFEFGLGDAFHTSNRIDQKDLYSHLDQVRHFYGATHPDQAALAAWLQEQLDERDPTMSWWVTNYLLDRLPDAPPAAPPPPDTPLGRHFPGLGLTFFRSGWGADDTYAVFTAGGRNTYHKQYDENSFVICRDGYLAIDTGTRPQPGIHLNNYYVRTVAHNAILIHQPGEAAPWYWGEPAPDEADLPPTNDGGMYTVGGAEVRAFHTEPAFTYVASDATACYRPAKCEQATRQFLHLQPNRFIVFDRVVSTRPEYAKTWLLHTVNEPRQEGRGFSAEHWNGRLSGQILLPDEPVVRIVGGPGAEFWCDGRNWPLPPADALSVPLERGELMGQWRIEVESAVEETETLFLHVLTTGPAGSDPPEETIEGLHDGDRVGVRLAGSGRSNVVWFGRSGPLSCEVRIHNDAGDTTYELHNAVQPQRGAGGAVAGAGLGPPSRPVFGRR